MAHLAVTVALLFLTCAYASPAPEPGNPKFTLLKDSAFGGAAASGGSKADGVVEPQNLAFESPVDTGDNAHDFTLVDNVNTGYAAAHGGSVATGLWKNNIFTPSAPSAGFASFGFK